MGLIDDYKDQISKLCREHLVDKLYLFGSAATNSMTPTSDIDFVVRFKAFDIANYFANYSSFKKQLHLLLNRNIDLLEEHAISNPYIKKSIENSKQLIYGQQN